MKSKRSYARKIKTKDLKTKIYSGNSNRFLPPQDYRTTTRLLHHCRYCKKFALSKDLSIYDGKLLYICPECGGRHKYSTAKISFQRFLKAFCFLFVILCAAVIFMSSQGCSIDDYEASNEKSQNYDVLTMGENSYKLKDETKKEFLFVAPKDGYYVFNSLRTCDPEDVNGQVIVDGEVVCKNDNFAETDSFYMVKHLKEGEEAVLSVDAHGDKILRFDVLVKTISKRYAAAIDIYNKAVKGFSISSSDTLYLHDASYDSDTGYYSGSDKLKAVTFRIDEENNRIWLGFILKNDGEEIYVWYPQTIEE